MIIVSLPKSIVILVEAHRDLTLVAVYFDLPLNFPTHEILILAV